MSSDSRAEALERVGSQRDSAPDLACTAWFLSPAERRNPATSIDDRGDGTAWTTGNRISLHHGRDYYHALHRELIESIEAVRGERAAVVLDLHQLVDLVLLRVAIFLIAAVMLAPLVAHAYARVWPRRWREPEK